MVNPPLAPLPTPAGLDWSEDQCLKLVDDLRSLGLDYSLDFDENFKTALIRKPAGVVIDVPVDEALSYLAGAYELAEHLAALETLDA
jgi:hypothetical protein